MKDELQCCVSACERPLDKSYWDHQYITNTVGWDLGEVSPPIKTYFDAISFKDAKILIPGCGNTYEAEYLLELGFTDITVIDIAPTLVQKLQEKFEHIPNLKIVLGDFFEHQGSYDYIIEQTFFCALPPTMRQQYVHKMHQLLSDNGMLIGLLFNRTFDQGPPFGGSKSAYASLFKGAFHFLQIDTATNSIAERANSELFIEFKKNNDVVVKLYRFEGITCSGCMDTIASNYLTIPFVKNASFNTAFNELLLVSSQEIPVELLQQAIAYDAKYKIVEVA